MGGARGGGGGVRMESAGKTGVVGEGGRKEWGGRRENKSKGRREKRRLGSEEGERSEGGGERNRVGRGQK